MDSTAIAGSVQLMKTAQTQQTMSVSMMKKASDQQNQMANLLAQNITQTPQPASSRSGFSTYA